MRRYALLGEKLSHSYSPRIHEEIFKDLNIEAQYELLEVNKEDLLEYIHKLKDGEYQGFNVTIPYKIEIMKYLDEISQEALEIGSVNTVACVNGKAIGYNTDYYGFYNELLYYNVPVRNKDCYVLGTGGASLAVCKALKDLGGNVECVSRTPNKGKSISYEELSKRKIDILINTTPVGMYPNCENCAVSEEIAKRANYVLDIIFNPMKTKLLEYADSNMNGLYMLVGQAVKAEEIWQGMTYSLKIENLLKRIEMKL